MNFLYQLLADFVHKNNAKGNLSKMGLTAFILANAPSNSAYTSFLNISDFFLTFSASILLNNSLF